MKVTASIVTYKTDCGELQRCIDSMLSDGVERIYISDNSPSDTLRSFCDGKERIEYIFNNQNLGYGRGHNVAIRKAMATDADYHLVINADVYFDQGVIPTITEYMERNTDVAMAHPKVFYPNGDLQYTVRLLPTPMNLIFRRFLPKSMAEKLDYSYLMKFNDHSQEMNVPYHQGSFLFFRIKCFETVGMFDERFFLYPEDIDITRRMHKSYRTMYLPFVKITHKHCAASYHNFRMLFVHIVNMIRYFGKWGWIFDKERTKWNKRIIEEYTQKQ